MPESDEAMVCVPLLWLDRITGEALQDQVGIRSEGFS